MDNPFSLKKIFERHLLPLHNTKMLTEKSKGLIRNLFWSQSEVSDLFEALLNRYKSKTTNPHVELWMMKMLHCIEINYITPDWKSGKTLVELVRDHTLTDEQLERKLSENEGKTLDQIIDEIEQLKFSWQNIDKNLLNDVKEIVSEVRLSLLNLKTLDDSSNNGQIKTDLLRLVRAVEATKKITPRLTQMVSWCIMALSEKGRLIQVSTGEGKTCIVAMFAAYRASQGEKVDIMSSSPVLAERDFKEWQDFYKCLDVRVSCNINKSDTDLKKCYECEVVYGTAHEFGADWLRHHFSRQDILGNRSFQCAIVDEVDSLMLDKGDHTVYLGCDMPALQHLNPLLARIWDAVHQHTKVCQYLNLDQETLIGAVKTQITSVLHFTPCDVSHDRGNCYVPGFLKDLVESELNIWIAKAFDAQTKTKDHEYVVESYGVAPVDFDCTGVIENFMEWCDGLHQFILMKHQQKLSDMKAVTNFMSNVGLLHMYEDQIYGVTGTLGERNEAETLQKIYNGITTCQIPTFKRRKLFEVEGVIVDDEKEWLEQICEVIKAEITCTLYRGKRAVLVICETIGRAKAVHKALGNTVQNKKLYISNNLDNKNTLDTELQPGDIIIATNLAGRGTDLSLSASVNAAGGLFVLQTFLPKNARVEAQAFGRTGRQGSPGSAQLVICLTHLPKQIQPLVMAERLTSLLRKIFRFVPISTNLFAVEIKLYTNGQKGLNMSETLSKILTRKSNLGIKLVKNKRDECVANELHDYLNGVIPTMKLKQELFSQYLEFLNDFYKSNNNKPSVSDLTALHEFWGVWLLINVNEKNTNEDLKTKLASDLQRARDTLRNRLSPLSNLHHYTLFGNELRKKGDFQASINMYTKAIQQDPSWAAIAYYNRAFVRLVQQDNNQSPDCIEQAFEDLQQALRSVKLYVQQNDIVSKYCKSHMDAELREALTRFDLHQQARRKVFELFQKNIEVALGKLNRARSIGGHVKVEEQLVRFLAPVEELFSELETRQKLLSKDLLKWHQINNHSDYDLIHEFESLKSLGLSNIYVLDLHSLLYGRLPLKNGKKYFKMSLN